MNDSPRQRTRPEAERPRRFGLAFLVAVGVPLLDVATIFFGASVLWATAGITVVSGSTFGLVVCLGGSILLVTLRCALAARQHTTNTVVAIVQAMLLSVPLIGLYAAWTSTGEYFLGWVTAYAGVYILFVNLVALMTRGRGNTAVVGIVPSAVAILAITATWMVWDWPVLIGTAAITTIATLMGLVVHSAIRGLRRSR